VDQLPVDYVLQTFYSYSKRPYFKKGQNVYNGECPVCHEGGSAGRKRRLFYMPEERYFYCFNCSRSWNELSWIHEVTKKQIGEILKETTMYRSSSATNLLDILDNNEPVTRTADYLPENSINLTDEYQLDYYKDNKVVQLGYECSKSRRLFTAINRPKSLYVTTTDNVHKNRLVIPFYSECNKIESYQTRALLPDQQPKYLTKYGEKCLYGENNINPEIPYIFIFEGPIDSMFVQNGVAMGGTSLTERQSTFINKCLNYEIIYVYDNDTDNQEMKKVIDKTIKLNRKLFIWPKEFNKYKDINEICVSLQMDEFPYKYIVENSFSGVEALLKTRHAKINSL